MATMEVIGSIGPVRRTRFDKDTETWYAEAPLDALCKVAQEHSSLLVERDAMLQKISTYEAGEPLLQERIRELNRRTEELEGALRQAVESVHLLRLPMMGPNTMKTVADTIAGAALAALGAPLEEGKKDGV